MSDFYHNGEIATLHLLKKDNLEQLEKDLRIFAKKKPIALILPSIYDELRGKALPRIVDFLKL